MDSFEALIGKNINDVSLNESKTFFIAPLKYSTKVCGKRYPSEKFKIADLDYFNLISFSKLFKREKLLIVWHDESGLITDLEIYHLSNDFDILFQDYYTIKKAIDDGEAHRLREGDTRYLGASRLSEKVPQPNSSELANKREFVLKKRFLQKIINEIEI
ncbi:hypothetical protein [Methanobrevibacter sp.]|uniref:hypothetical protein n=1 Tax=Methanobrevibacter sp. TaxID=66852 RepID=UPI002E762900|nr:hypothetical protein [Methanobrevibacter sp.]MEE1335113.1 hypothetical protein [Methanobrevibacter sp.]